jgi:ankyrin repeat protein
MLHAQVARGVSKDELKKLLSSYDIRSRDNEGQTALHVAAAHGHSELCRLLLRKDHKLINERDSNGWTALLCAANVGELKACEALLNAKGVDAQALNADGASALAYLVKQRVAESDKTRLSQYMSVLKLCVDRGGDVNWPNRSGESPIHYACLRGNAAAVRFLVDEKCNVNILNRLGETGLHYAVRASHIDIVRVLLAAGADPTIRSEAQHTPISVAISKGLKDITELISEYRQDLNVDDHRGVDGTIADGGVAADDDRDGNASAATSSAAGGGGGAVSAVRASHSLGSALSSTSSVIVTSSSGGGGSSAMSAASGSTGGSSVSPSSSSSVVVLDSDGDASSLGIGGSSSLHSLSSAPPDDELSSSSSSLAAVGGGSSSMNGYLMRHVRRSKWQRLYFALHADGTLRFANSVLEPSLGAFRMRHTTVRDAPSSKVAGDKDNCFEIASSERTFVLSAKTNLSRQQWIQALRVAAVAAARDALGVDDAHQHQHQHHHRIASPRYGGGGRSQGDDDSTDDMDDDSSATAGDANEPAAFGSSAAGGAVASMTASDAVQVEVQALCARDDNGRCADCSRRDPGWVSMQPGVFVCIECSTFHRNHNMPVKSIMLDQWSGDELQCIRKMGNQKGRIAFEYSPDAIAHKPSPQSPRDAKRQYVHAKYVKRAFAPDAKAPKISKTMKERHDLHCLLASRVVALDVVYGHMRDSLVVDILGVQPHLAAALERAPLYTQAQKVAQGTLKSMDYHVEQTGALVAPIISAMARVTLHLDQIVKALSKKAGADVKLEPKLLSAALDVYESRQRDLPDPHVEVIFAWWLPLVLEVYAIVDIRGYATVAPFLQRYVAALRQNTVAAIYLLAGEYLFDANRSSDGSGGGATSPSSSSDASKRRRSSSSSRRSASSGKAPSFDELTDMAAELTKQLRASSRCLFAHRHASDGQPSALAYFRDMSSAPTLTRQDSMRVAWLPRNEIVAVPTFGSFHSHSAETNAAVRAVAVHGAPPTSGAGAALSTSPSGSLHTNLSTRLCHSRTAYKQSSGVLTLLDGATKVSIALEALMKERVSPFIARTVLAVEQRADIFLPRLYGTYDPFFDGGDEHDFVPPNDDAPAAPERSPRSASSTAQRSPSTRRRTNSGTNTKSSGRRSRRTSVVASAASSSSSSKSSSPSSSSSSPRQVSAHRFNFDDDFGTQVELTDQHSAVDDAAAGAHAAGALALFHDASIGDAMVRMREANCFAEYVPRCWPMASDSAEPDELTRAWLRRQVLILSSLYRAAFSALLPTAFGQPSVYGAWVRLQQFVSAALDALFALPSADDLDTAEHARELVSLLLVHTRWGLSRIVQAESASFSGASQLTSHASSHSPSPTSSQSPSPYGTPPLQQTILSTQASHQHLLPATSSSSPSNKGRRFGRR